MSGQEYGRRRRRRRREDVQLLIECLPQPWALSAALTNQTLSPVGLFPLPAKVFRSAGTASIAEEKGCLLRYKMVKQRRAGRKLSKGRGNVVRMSVIPFVCCARRQGLAVSRARYQTIYNTAVDYTELKGRKRQCACDRVRELVHVAPCVFVPSCRAGRDLQKQKSRFAYSAIAAAVPRTEAAERKFQTNLKLEASWSAANLAAGTSEPARWQKNRSLTARAKRMEEEVKIERETER
ncbi:hypothetical protein HDV62DRAFT_232515 [Trichoderma sp. SZMC 28011]